MNLRDYVLLLALAFVFALTGCRSTEELFRSVDADIWLSQKIPDDICASMPGLEAYGIYRVVKCRANGENPPKVCDHGELTYEEFVPYCDPAIEKYVTMHKDRFKSWVSVAKKEIKSCR